MTTIAALRTTYLNGLLERTDGTQAPWGDTLCNQALGDAIADLWPRAGAFTSGTVATNQNDYRYTLPASIQRVARIDLEQNSGGQVTVVDHITAFHYIAYGPGTTQIGVAPQLVTDSTIVLRVYGYKPYLTDATDLPADGRLDRPVCFKAAAELFGMLTGKLQNMQQQQALDPGRIITYADAVGLSAYWQRVYDDRMSKLSMDMVTAGPRHAYAS